LIVRLPFRLRQLGGSLDHLIDDQLVHPARGGKGYQTSINRALREYVAKREREGAE
jgi:hypothetical protein